MHRQPAGAWLILLRGSALFLSGCVDTAQSPGSRPEPPTVEAPDGSMLAPLDLVYVCGNKFLATNSTNSPTSLRELALPFRAVQPRWGMGNRFSWAPLPLPRSSG